MSTFERARSGSALALKIQSSDGADAIAGTPAAGDWIGASFTPPGDNVMMVEDDSAVGSLDGMPPIVGGQSVSIPFRMPLRGSGTAAGAPEIARLLQSTSFIETATGSAVGAPTAATAGGVGFATFQTPFGTTLQQYRGMPITLSGNPSTAVTTMITNYTAGRQASFSRSFSPSLSTSTLGQIPINNLYSPSDTESDWKRLTAYCYYAGQLLIALDCQVERPVFELEAGKPVFFSGTLRGIVGTTWTETALPSGAAAAAASRLTPPLWLNGESQMGRGILRAQTVRVEIGTALDMPPNPENPNGFDSPQILARAVRITIAAAANSTTSPTRFGLYQAGTDTLWSAMVGRTAGNRFGFTQPLSRIVGFSLGERNGLGYDTMTLAPSSPGASLFVASY